MKTEARGRYVLGVPPPTRQPTPSSRPPPLPERHTRNRRNLIIILLFPSLSLSLFPPFIPLGGMNMKRTAASDLAKLACDTLELVVGELFVLVLEENDVATMDCHATNRRRVSATSLW